ncbi:hypothetical protein E3A20_16960 [Planctomyces bekefii]|uniref:Uncharacterized protein n=1 Tax=Planctomyces bekefii TaxID=1653850 RepID=A0A5C6M396_9PLAN|nr:hypothetical protein E3A20_16960 [Planctomyces bekefii]
MDRRRQQGWMYFIVYARARRVLVNPVSDSIEYALRMAYNYRVCSID